MRYSPRRLPLSGSLLLMVFGLGSAPGGLSAQDAQALALLEEAGARYSQIQGFCATFEQTLSVPLLGDTTYSKGSLCQERPNLFAMRFSDPDGDILLADGDFFWVYYPSSDPRQVIQFEMEDRPGGVDFQREFLEAPAGKYEMEYLGEESVSGRSTHLISVNPFDRSSFRAARIWLDAERSLILRARIEMENESVRTVTLSEIQLDPTPDPDRFRFVPPQGAQVIRRD